MAEYFVDEESKEEIEFKDDILNYRGYFVENGDEEEKKFYEYGAHFPYMYLYQRLEILAQERKSNKKQLEKKLENKEKKIININNKDSKDDPITNEESKQNENLKDLLNIFKQKGKSRNRGDVDIGLTYMPHLNRKKEEQSNAIENIAAGLIKSSAGKNEESKINASKNIKNMKKNNLNKKEELNGANLKYNNFINKNKKNDTNNNSKVTKKIKSGKQQTKIRKRNENKIWNINNTLNGNTLSLNILNKTKLGEKNNSKNMTHDIPYMTKLKNNLVNKLKSIQYSKEKLREQILHTGNIGQNKNKRGNIKKMINKFRNLNNKGSYNGYQNTKNTSSSKNLVTNNKKEMNKISKIDIPSVVNTIKEKLEKNNNNVNNNSKIKNKTNNRNMLNNNNNNFINQNNFLSNLKTNNKSKNIYNVNKNLIKKANVTSKNNISINNNTRNQNQKNKIPNNNYKTVLLQKENIKSSSINRNQNEFLENMVSKKSKNNVSRNNNIPIFNNQIQNSLNKNFHSVNVNNQNKNNKPKSINTNINLTKNLNNLNQQNKTLISNKIKEINVQINKNCASNANLKKYSPGKASHKKSTDSNNINKKPGTQKRKNINNIQEQLKSYLLKVNNMKGNITMNKIKKVSGKSTHKNKNNVKINSDNDINKKKNIVSRNRGENNNINAEKISTKKNNTMMQNKKKHHININININNQQNIILNKLSNGLNNNSINICSVRSSDNKEINNNKMDKNQINNPNYVV